MSRYQPPLTLTLTMLALVAEISEQVGRLSARHESALTPQLRRGNRIRTIQASLAIENNTLSVEQVTAVLDGKRVLGLPREIQEVRNAFAAYEAMPGWSLASCSDLLAAHGLLMHALIDEAGQFRHGGVGIYRGEALVHMALPPSRVPQLVDDLLDWLSRTDLHPLIASCVFHYEFEFIHPFADGNGRMGRLWQTLILSQWRPVLAWLPVETVIRDRQDAYYAALSAADRQAEATPFVEFMLQALLRALEEAVESETGSSVQSAEESSEETPLLTLLRSNPSLTAKQAAERLGLSQRAVEKQLAALKAGGRLRRIGPNKGGHWQVT
ncbi:Fic family protein [Azotobacter chroococcum]|uniref:Filamentation induced by cAMP protein Fic n=1 Tax=Azotobacter chroococcum NCIMB 8003 TaxID=1328314 RepID=A0A0C4WNC9_9GAMM|nr:Fic family protein [Azotobacter chroococcum]AJE22036.1 Filamentation induced by cAMP protein Fic [Azotobacter chroococcum NCIMB 8003]